MAGRMHEILKSTRRCEAVMGEVVGCPSAAGRGLREVVGRCSDVSAEMGPRKRDWLMQMTVLNVTARGIFLVMISWTAKLANA